MKTLKLALAGAWHVHTRIFMPMVKKALGEAVDWVSVYDRDAVRGKEAAKLLSCPFVSSYQEILDNPEIDVIVIEAETCDHKEMILQAAKAGKNVFCEKILAITTDDALEIKRAIEESGIKFGVSHEALTVAPYMYTKKLLDEGVFGDFVSMHFRRAHGMAKKTLNDEWFSRKIAGGGDLIDLGIHGASMLAFLGGKPKRVSAFTHNFTGHETEDSATILVEFENGGIGTAHTDMVTSIMENNFELVGTDGMITVTGTDRSNVTSLQSTHIPSTGSEMCVIPAEQYSNDCLTPIVHFIREVMLSDSGRRSVPGLDIDTAVTVVRLVEAAYESAATGTSVAF